MTHTSTRSTSAARCRGLAAVALALMVAGCAPRGTGSVDISASKQAAADKGIAPPGPRTVGEQPAPTGRRTSR